MLIGPIGTGKDHLMTAVMRWAVMHWGLVPFWADGQELFASVRDAYAEDATETSTINAARRADLVALSDPVPGVGRITDHQRNMLHRLIDGCYRNPRPMLATINVATRQELDDRKLDNDHADRLPSASPRLGPYIRKPVS